MGKKISGWKTKGMNRDMSVSAFNAEFAFENVNLRLSTNENNTTMSWVNERGPLLLTLSIDIDPWETEDKQPAQTSMVGVPIGTAVINHKLVVFTTRVGNSKPDNIYVLWYDNDEKTSMVGKRLYRGKLNFNIEYPLETLVSYEAEHIQKVYWTDGLNQPRMINIAADNDKLKLWNTSNSPIGTFFDFIPSIQFDENIKIEKRVAAGGLFAPGVIQYCFTYINKHGQQSNVFHVSTLYYLALSERGASPEEKVTCCFDIKMSNADQKFDYVRIYSIQRTSLNNVPFVKLLTDIPVSNIASGDPVTIYVDDGTSGSTMDPTELLYIGGHEITALTMADKDQTLFFGNITQKNTSVIDIQKYFDSLRETPTQLVQFDRDDLHSEEQGYTQHKSTTLDHTYGIYSHTNMLDYDRQKITSFKGGENYRFGFQLQKATGEWTDPIFLDDVVNDKYPYTNIYSDDISLPFAKATLDFSNLTGVDMSVYKRIRPVIVYPTITDRIVLCQGVLNPTLFNAMDRIGNSPFAQASWYFRPYMVTGSKSAGTQYATDDYITVTASPILTPEEPAIAIPSGFEDAHEVYALVADIENENIDYILQNGTLHFGMDYGGSTAFYTQSFSGAIKLGDAVVASDTTRYAFFFYNYRPTNFVRGAYDNGRSCFMEDNPFMLYNGVHTTANHLFYYEGNIDYDSFDFYIFDPDVTDPVSSITHHGYGTILYEVTFSQTQSSQGGSSEYVPVVGADSGDAVSFVHYDSLFTTSSGSYDDNRKVEIQGAQNIYMDAFSDKDTSVKSNTQFMIDQSIVTLNSPDIEFDTEVQVYGNEGLKLRIVGAIPITANVSAHSIETSTAMLEKYHGDTTVTKHLFGSGELDYNVLHNNIDIKAGNRLVAEYLWNDTIVQRKNDAREGEDNYTTGAGYDWLIYPWNRKGPLNNDFRTEADASSVLSKKKESNLMYSINSEYFEPHYEFPTWQNYNYTDIGCRVHLTENNYVLNMRLPRQKTTSSEINYYPNIDKVLYNENGYKPIAANLPTTITLEDISSPVSMKYKSTSHAVISMNVVNDEIPILPYASYDTLVDEHLVENAIGKYDNPIGRSTTFWGDTDIAFSQKKIDITNMFTYHGIHQNHNFLWLGELYKEPANPFGGKTAEACRNNTWLIGGDSVNLNGNTVELYWTEGDTYYQRYDCLKTYSFTPEDTNQIIEILSFMCEAHTNIDGRYDRNRGQTDNTNMSPQNFNILNPVYTQQNNFFSSKIANTDNESTLHYPNHIYYSKTKQSGADVDLWTNVTLASTLEMDGDKGQITSLNRMNNQLIAFQDTGIAHILYNENTQISTTEGVPIEIANSGKVQGKRYISDTIGCSNKWSVVTTPSGIYFMDSNDKSINLFNGQLSNVSLQGGFNTWAKQNIPSSEIPWNPVDFDNFKAYYDKLNQDVLFTNKETTLAFSERMNAFTSFYDYGNTPYLCNLDDTGVWIRGNGSIWKHNAGQYSNFFGENKPYSTILIGNPEPQADKIFTNLEFRACVDGEGSYDSQTDKFTPALPFDYLETWNEYQHGITTLNIKNGLSAFKHYTSDDISTLKRKFRIWRCDIPRDNALLSSDAGKNITRFKVQRLNRMRNPWVYLRLQKEADQGTMGRTEIHDIIMTYFS